mmetsp:Transcript_4594/g.9401  ORF Transcript_4594/g.9401 Transcript_4594/m.9401 type:complete len:246 (-) Transcript_4594:178-915(-)
MPVSGTTDGLQTDSRTIRQTSPAADHKCGCCGTLVRRSSLGTPDQCSCLSKDPMNEVSPPTSCSILLSSSPNSFMRAMKAPAVCTRSPSPFLYLRVLPYWARVAVDTQHRVTRESIDWFILRVSFQPPSKTIMQSGAVKASLAASARSTACLAPGAGKSITALWHSRNSRSSRSCSSTPQTNSCAPNCSSSFAVFDPRRLFSSVWCIRTITRCRSRTVAIPLQQQCVVSNQQSAHLCPGDARKSK